MRKLLSDTPLTLPMGATIVRGLVMIGVCVEVKVAVTLGWEGFLGVTYAAVLAAGLAEKNGDDNGNCDGGTAADGTGIGVDGGVGREAAIGGEGF